MSVGPDGTVLASDISADALEELRSQAGGPNVDFSPLGHLGDRLRMWNEAFYANPDDPMIDFDEKDLEHFFLDAGFIDVRLELGADEHQVQGDRPYVFLTASKP